MNTDIFGFILNILFCGFFFVPFFFALIFLSLLHPAELIVSYIPLISFHSFMLNLKFWDTLNKYGLLWKNWQLNAYFYSPLINDEGFSIKCLLNNPFLPWRCFLCSCRSYVSSFAEGLGVANLTMSVYLKMSFVLPWF